MRDSDAASRLVSLSRAAAVLDVSSRDLAAAVAAGELPHVRVGARSVLVDIDAVRAALLKRAQAKEGERGQ